MAKKNKKEVNQSLEKTLWQPADKLRKNMDAAEYKHIVLGLIFLKYISDSFEDHYKKLVNEKDNYEGEDPVAEVDGIPFNEKMSFLTEELKGSISEGNRLDKEMKKQLVKIGFELLGGE